MIPIPLIIILLTLTACAKQQQSVSQWMAGMSNTDIDYGGLRTKMKNTEEIYK